MAIQGKPDSSALTAETEASRLGCSLLSSSKQDESSLDQLAFPV